MRKKLLAGSGAIALLLGFALTFAACEGPQGPAGGAGDPGAPGAPGIGIPGMPGGMPQEIATVYFTSVITPESLVAIFERAFNSPSRPDGLAATLSLSDVDDLLDAIENDGFRVGINIHGGEFGACAWLPRTEPGLEGLGLEGQVRGFALEPVLVRGLYDLVEGWLLETNVSYGPATAGGRRHTAGNLQIMEDFGFTVANFPRRYILDDGTTPISIPVNVGRRLDSLLVGNRLMDFDFYINLNHFTGHGQAGFGGALKNMSLGIATGGYDHGIQRGKVQIHSGGRTGLGPFQALFPGGPAHPTALFQEAIAEGSLAVRDYLEAADIYMLHITVLNNLDIDCDCVAGRQHRPDILCIGIIASWDPIAIDQASMDLIWRRNSEVSALVEGVPALAFPRAALAVAPDDLPLSVRSDDRWRYRPLPGLGWNTGLPLPLIDEAVARGARADGQGASLIGRMVMMNGQHKLAWGQAIGLGSIVYRLVDID